MPDKNRIPRADDKFSNYINGTAAYLLLDDGAGTLPYWERLGLLVAEKNKWVAFKNDWNTKYQDVLNNILLEVEDRKLIRAKNKIKKDFNDFVLDPETNLLTRIDGSPNVNANDRSMFNIKVRDTNPSARPEIDTVPNVGVKNLGGAGIGIIAHIEGVSRPAIQPDADTLEMRYIIKNLDEDDPASPEECPFSDIFKKARVTFPAGVGNAGKRLCAFFRWRNVSEPLKSSLWTEPVTIVIGG